ncbi:hypothetical protein KHA96_16320 [Bacillus sp. FJAT-49711]|uniref:hypothetical protein n=1 Tax=Bacillus sp. FJAT-49711 TaxID=2833585 RepID=UPI001BCA259D|nr:hypothetical protein [Bacillus sp. FJAT-49711]MBS4219880.1 hypothetical protein [Bacillus sp. FJAT-49711]
MDLTSKQQSVLGELTVDWKTPIQIAERLPQAEGNLSDVNETLIGLVSAGLVQANPTVFGLYRLTEDGMNIKKLDKSNFDS